MRAEQVLRDATRSYGEQIQPTQAWEQIEEAINTRPRRVRRRAWIAVSAAAASIAVVVTAAVIVTGGGNQVEVGQVAANGPEGWSELTPPPDELAQRDAYGSVWTGEELIIWGGVRGDALQSDGFAYDLETDTWRRVPDAPIAGEHPTVMWTGEEVLVWVEPSMSRLGTGVQAIEGSPPPAALGAAYDPASDTWRPLTAPPDDVVGIIGELVWVDGRVVATAAGPWMEYDPARDSWRELDGVTGTGGPMASAAGSWILVWTPWDDQPGIAYDLREGEATPMEPVPESMFLQAFLQWTGSELIVWGEGEYSEEAGFAYDPEMRRWRRIPESPLSRRAQTDFGTSAWTGRELIIWGGRAGRDVLSDGAAYDPGAGRWRTLPDPPGSRDRYTGGGLTRTVAAWTGAELLIAQGDAFVAYRSG